jgi:hypothetical protein
MRPDSFIAIIDPPSFGRYSGTTNVRYGYGVAYFSAAEDLEPGTNAKITLKLRPRRTQSLHASIAAEVAPLPMTADSGEGQIATPNINPQWVTAGDPFWVDNNWDRSSVAKVVRGTDSVEIYVSAENEKLSSLIAKAQRRNVEAVDAIKDFYLEHISFQRFFKMRTRLSQPPMPRMRTAAQKAGTTANLRGPAKLYAASRKQFLSYW